MSHEALVSKFERRTPAKHELFSLGKKSPHPPNPFRTRGEDGPRYPPPPFPSSLGVASKGTTRRPPPSWRDLLRGISENLGKVWRGTTPGAVVLQVAPEQPLPSHSLDRSSLATSFIYAGYRHMLMSQHLEQT
jgi:hypothetical protein